MTRINVVPPAELSRQHLLAEYRELPRIFGLVRRAQARGEQPNLSEVPRYTLGKGHVRFFYPRLAWLMARYVVLKDEMKRRGYKVRDYPDNIADGIKHGWWQHWEITEEALTINRARIKERTR